MKRLIFIFLACAAFSCSSDSEVSYSDCQAEKERINAYYEAQILQAVENNDSRQVSLLYDERAEALKNACK